MRLCCLSTIFTSVKRTVNGEIFTQITKEILVVSRRRFGSDEKITYGKKMFTWIIGVVRQRASDVAEEKKTIAKKQKRSLLTDNVRAIDVDDSTYIDQRILEFDK